MKKYKFAFLFLSAASIVLEILPFGAVCNFADPDGAIRETFSYFSLTPYAYANFGPFITAVLSVILLLIAAALFVSRSVKFITAASVLSAFSVFFSLLPLMLGLTFFSATGALISAALIVQLVILIKYRKTRYV